ncbi:MAG: decarboxylase [Flavobacteriales bacterium]|nr:decarboxylase [Flavobacteriales bacterium]
MPKSLYSRDWHESVAANWAILKKTALKHTILTLTILATFSCATAPDADDHFKVEYAGALKNIMHKGDLSAQADLTEFQDTEHFYALGAVENLKGEILILDSKPFISSVQDQNLSISNSFDNNGTLLVYASVDKWASLSIPDNVSTYQDLEKHIEQTARDNGINTEKPFPFLINGRVKSFDWHVIDWKDGDTEHSHEKHISSGLHGTLSDQDVEILGFYSNSHHAIFTHHTTNMHLHVKTTDNQLSGHLDGLTLGQGMTLKLPDVK